ncbi:MAG: hypothetical protein A2857_02770 [Candidatus Levybacteria bacterium RIFCSPHIGHO2_01_FULL_36_15]|nr:MAG: hypothetical protein A2857_02770 [Candidatus Levybacteria bacterium RIFCSPHIGHO2_01_FULL_36_15]
MLIPPKYILTSKISQSLQSIEANRQVINSILVPPEIETNIRRQSILKSSLFSARIEGNPLTLEEITHKASKDQKKIEVFNILRATQFIYNRGAADMTLKTILEIHGKVMDKLGTSKGKFRAEISAIFNTAGIAVYLPPPPRQIPTLMEKLLSYINSSKEPFVPVRACLSHYIFEKIHPFLDGNGRVGRLMLTAVLEKSGYGMKGLLTIEEYLDSHRSQYYQSLEDIQRDTTSYLEFMLAAVAATSEKAKEIVLTKQKITAEDYLLPRRAEILNIIKDHGLVSFDMIRRRFLAVNERTLRYDLKKLQNSGLIKKRGNTKGVYYEIPGKVLH